ncbi:hypothetical protein NDA18_005537 [Ustilago nuda]|nr:hypothetical protein NDA18_005537 [Ustilago nuda]
MAFRQTLTRPASKHISSYGTVLDRFLNSHNLSTSFPSTRLSSSPSTQIVSLFEPTKSAITGCWAPPKYSLRRQAKLVKEAALTNQLSSLPDGPKSTCIQQRLHRLAKSHAFEQKASQYQYIPRSASASPAVWIRGQVLGERVVKPKQRESKQEREEAMHAARLHVKDVGPYSGRARIFKGSRVDKDKQRRWADVEARLDKMRESKKEWQEGQREARIKLKPGLPF